MKDEIKTSTPPLPAPCEFVRGTKQLAARLGVAEVTVRRAVRRHTLPVIRFGGALLFRWSDVEKTLHRLTIPSLAMVSEHKGREGA